MINKMNFLDFALPITLNFDSGIMNFGRNSSSSTHGNRLTAIDTEDRGPWARDGRGLSTGRQGGRMKGTKKQTDKQCRMYPVLIDKTRRE